MAEAPKVTPEQQRTLDGLQDAIVACNLEAAKTAAEQVLAAGVAPADALEGVAVARRLVTLPGGAHA